jgi:hypothetical protein
LKLLTTVSQRIEEDVEEISFGMISKAIAALLERLKKATETSFGTAGLRAEI